MGIKHHTDRGDVRELSHELDWLRHRIEETMGELDEARRHIPDADEAEHALAPAPPDARRDLHDSCISLDLALRDAQRWARRIREKTPPADGRDPLDPG